MPVDTQELDYGQVWRHLHGPNVLQWVCVQGSITLLHACHLQSILQKTSVLLWQLHNTTGAVWKGCVRTLSFMTFILTHVLSLHYLLLNSSVKRIKFLPFIFIFNQLYWLAYSSFGNKLAVSSGVIFSLYRREKPNQRANIIFCSLASFWNNS